MAERLREQVRADRTAIITGRLVSAALGSSPSTELPDPEAAVAEMWLGLCASPQAAQPPTLEQQIEALTIGRR